MYSKSGRECELVIFSRDEEIEDIEGGFGRARDQGIGGRIGESPLTDSGSGEAESGA